MKLEEDHQSLGGYGEDAGDSPIRAPMNTVLRAVDYRGVGTITLNRPEKLNAFTIPDMPVALEAAVGEFEHDRRVRVVVIEGAGRAFSAGGDYSHLSTLSESSSHHVHSQLRSTVVSAIRRVKTCEKPTIAAIRGPAYGLGCELALACDLRVATGAAAFSERWTVHGAIPPTGGLYLLPRIVGLGVATDLILTGRTVPAEEALRIGLVSRLFSEDQFDTGLAGLIDDLLGIPERSLVAAKSGLQFASDATLEQAWIHGTLQQSLLIPEQKVARG